MKTWTKIFHASPIRPILTLGRTPLAAVIMSFSELVITIVLPHFFRTNMDNNNWGFVLYVASSQTANKAHV